MWTVPSQHMWIQASQSHMLNSHTGLLAIIMDSKPISNYGHSDPKNHCTGKPLSEILATYYLRTFGAWDGTASCTAKGWEWEKKHWQRTGAEVVWLLRTVCGRSQLSWKKPMRQLTKSDTEGGAKVVNEPTGWETVPRRSQESGSWRGKQEGRFLKRMTHSKDGRPNPGAGKEK